MTVHLIISSIVFLVMSIFGSTDYQPDLTDPFTENEESETKSLSDVPFLVVLGTIQDGGSPHIGCKKDCCNELFLNPDNRRKVVSLGIIDPQYKKRYLFEATPDLPAQMQMLMQSGGIDEASVPNGIFLTHAHIGHYTGLMYLGKEAINSDRLPVYAMPRMKHFLEVNGPWSQLVSAGNIALKEIHADMGVQLTPSLRITPLMVPHRDEYSETVGFRIDGPDKSVLFIPDIDKWEKWERSIIEEIGKVDYAFVDGTFYDAAEINYRNISEIPHPFIIESMAMFDNLPDAEKEKICFIHLNHTNPALDPNSVISKEIVARGFRLATFGMKIKL